MLRNVNDSVKVQLTEHGKTVARAWHERVVKGLVPYSEPVELDGWSRWQLWQLMHIFGPEMWMGNTRQVFVDNQIRLAEEE